MLRTLDSRWRALVVAAALVTLAVAAIYVYVITVQENDAFVGRPLVWTLLFLVPVVPLTAALFVSPRRRLALLVATIVLLSGGLLTSLFPGFVLAALLVLLALDVEESAERARLGRGSAPARG